ncbi:hypothetical protein AB0F72_30410 [Actinoplanes sp. NPDC023936]|uniref:hypothetical protein n=1 Tax=Actinoplanes sp. NPDC023936 TaxID=3154910 RepID=UPI00340BE2C6
MSNDDVRRPGPVRRPVARLASPAGLVLAGLCLLLPFLSASCESAQTPVRWQVTYTGVDIFTGGRPEVAFTGDAGREPIRRLDDAEAERVLGAPPEPLPPQPVAWVAVTLMAAALAAAVAVPSRRWRAAATAGLALAAAVVLAGATTLARRDAADAVAAVVSKVVTSSGPSVPELRRWEHYDQVSDLFSYGYGFWLAIVALSAVGVAGIVGVLRDPAGERDEPAAATREA